MKKAGGWVPWVSKRFLTGRRGGRGRLVFIFAVVLIGSGVATLNTILAVMNGLQQGYIRSILEIGSYHLRWSPDSSDSNDIFNLSDIEKVISSDSGVEFVLPFREGQTMLSGERPRPVGALIRGVPENLYEQDEALAENMEIVRGDFRLNDGGIVLGEELALELGLSVGDSVTALDLGSAGLSSSELPLEVSGLFRCGYRDYEASLAFVSLDTSENLFGATALELGIKLHRVDGDRKVMARLDAELSESGGRLISWRESNRSFFGALRTEKIMMLLLLALIFVVVSVNIDHSLRRMATERVEDLSVLKALGASPSDIRLLFLRYGLMIGGSGGIVGSLLGVLIGANVDAILNAVGYVRDLFAGLFGFGYYGAGSMASFFQRSEVMARDVLIIFVLAVVLSSLSAFRAASMAARLKPAEVLRSE